MNAQNTSIATVEETTEVLPAGYGGANTSLAISLARAEVDQQIATARAMPRSITRAVKNILTLATLDEESAEECVYALPRGGKPIKGPSVRLAEIIASQWGNCRVGTRVVHVDRFEKIVEAEGVFHDLETNMAVTSRVRRRITDKKGNLFNDDMIVVTGNAAASIAKRNAILGAVPKAVWRQAYQAVEQVIAGDIATLSVRREKAFKAFAAFGVKPEQIFEVLEIGGADDVTLEHLPVLTGMHSALKSGESTVEEMFPTKQAAQPAKVKSSAARMEALAGGVRPSGDEKPAHDPETGEIKEQAGSGEKSAPAAEAPAIGPAVSPEGAEGAAPRQGQQGAVADDASSKGQPAAAPASPLVAEDGTLTPPWEDLDPETPKAITLRRVLKAISSGEEWRMTDEEADALSEADHDALGEIMDAVAGARG